MNYATLMIKKIITMIRCPFCHAEWIPTVKEPKQCPRCKRMLATYKGDKK